MKHDYNAFWERCWKEDDSTELYKYLDKYFELEPLVDKYYKSY